MRNHYESEIGYFENAIRPDVDTFRDSLDIIEKQLANQFPDYELYNRVKERCEQAEHALIQETENNEKMRAEIQVLRHGIAHSLKNLGMQFRHQKAKSKVHDGYLHMLH